MPRRRRSMARASAGSTSSMCSGSSQRRMSGGREKKNHEPHEHRREPREADLPVGHLGEALEGLAPELRRRERENAFDHQHERERREDEFAHGAELLPRPGFLRYLKKSDDGSSTITSPLLRRLLRYASMLR